MKFSYQLFFNHLKNPYIKSLLKSFLAIGGLILLLLIYRLIVFRIDGGDLYYPLKTLRTLTAFMEKQGELKYLLYATGLSFLLINFTPKGVKHQYQIVFILVAYIWILYRIFNLAHIYYSGAFIGRDFLSHIEKSSLSMLFNLKALLLFLLPLPIVFYVHLLSKNLDYSSYSPKLRLLALIILSLLFYASVYLIKIDRGSLSLNLWMSEFTFCYPNATQVPEKNLFSFLKNPSELAKNQDDDLQEKLSSSTKEKLKFFGIRVNEKAKMPLSKEYVFTREFPFPRIKNRSAPNIIIFVMESLSSRLLGYYGSPFKGISPDIDKFAKASLVISPFYNSTTPTINGLVSILCSHYPVYGHEDWIDQRGNMRFDLLCLPEALKERGYYSYNITGGDPYFAKQLPILKANGMDEVLGALEIKKFLKEDPLGSVFEGKAYSDHQVTGFLIEGLRTNLFKEPFTLTISTTDLHPPFRLPGDSIRYPHEENPILHLVHNADAAFGKFWNYFKNSRYSGDTVIILTADHSLFPGIKYKRLIGDQEIGFYDEIPLIIYDPIHKLPEKLTLTSSSVDIVPSLLHLLNLNRPNSFEGLSLFDSEGRIKYQNLLGSHPYLFFYRLNNKNKYFSREDLKCDEQHGNNIPSLEKDLLTPCDYFYWWRYKRWLIKKDLLWKEEGKVYSREFFHFSS
ncbi:MAG: LTA synthase family protein [Nitrospirota bacterium]